MQKRRITAHEVLENRFYQLPKFLIHNVAFKKLSADAKLLYAIMRDRHQLSLKNNWVDPDGHIFLIYSRENMMADLQLSDKTITKAVKDLQKHGLIDEVRQGQGKPNLIYVMTVALESQETRKTSESTIVKNTALDPEDLRPNDTKTQSTEPNETEIIQQQPLANSKKVVVVKPSTTPSSAPPKTKIGEELIQLYKHCFDQKPTQAVQQQLARMLLKFEKDAIEMALQMASHKGKAFDYALGILKKWKQVEAFTIDDIFDYDSAYAAGKI